MSRNDKNTQENIKNWNISQHYNSIARATLAEATISTGKAVYIYANDENINTSIN